MILAPDSTIFTPMEADIGIAYFPSKRIIV